MLKVGDLCIAPLKVDRHNEIGSTFARQGTIFRAININYNVNASRYTGRKCKALVEFVMDILRPLDLSTCIDMFLEGASMDEFMATRKAVTNHAN